MIHKSINSITIDHSHADRLVIRNVTHAPALPGEITIRVTAISLNRGETKRALTTSASGTRPGWDFAGIVEETYGVTAAPAIGTRVAGLLLAGAWSERIHAPLSSIAIIPDGVTDAQAASLPLAGLTALHALRKGGFLLGRKVLVDGATGGVGQIAIQLAAAAGAEVYSHIRRPEQRSLVESSSTGNIIVGASLESARSFGPFDLIIDSIGGASLSAAITMLRKNGTCVTFGASEGEPVSFDGTALFSTPGATLRSMIVFDEIAATEPVAEGLTLLLQLTKKGILKPTISVEAPWTEIATIARQLVDRRFTGKAVLHLTDQYQAG